MADASGEDTSAIFRSHPDRFATEVVVDDPASGRTFHYTVQVWIPQYFLPNRFCPQFCSSLCVKHRTVQVQAPARQTILSACSSITLAACDRLHVID